MIAKNRFRLGFLILTLLSLAIAIFFTGVVENFRGARIDLSEDNLYTLSDSAEGILQRLKVPVQLKYYVTGQDKMPTELKNLERDVRDKLQDYADASGGMIDFSIHDPSLDEEQQEALVAKGIRPFQVQTVERDERSLKLIWSAISIAYKDNPEEILPQVLPQTLVTFEYELLSRVFRMTQDRRPVLALYAQRPELDPEMMQAYMQMGMAPPEMPDTWQQLVEVLQSELYDVRRVDLRPESPIPADADALLVMNPRNLDARQSWEIGNAVSKGVNTLLAIQNMEYDYQPGQRGGFRITPKQFSSGLENLLREYGIAVGNMQLFDAEHETLTIPRQSNLGGMTIQTAEPVRVPMQIGVRGEQLNRDVSITNRIESLFYPWGTDVQVDPIKMASRSVGSRVLFTSSSRSWHKSFAGAPLAQADVSVDGQDFDGPHPLGWIFDGVFAEPEGGMPDWEQPDTLITGEPFVQGEAAAAQLMVLGCGKMFEQPFLGGAQNAMLLLNSVDALALGGELIGIRSRVITQRSLEPIEPATKLIYRIFTVVLVPVLIALFGIFRMILRRKESALYLENLKARS
ncbi:GldG family protein [bacterium]|nr:GldG family protein [bacterium]